MHFFNVIFSHIDFQCGFWYHIVTTFVIIRRQAMKKNLKHKFSVIMITLIMLIFSITINGVEFNKKMFTAFSYSRMMLSGSTSHTNEENAENGRSLSSIYKRVVVVGVDGAGAFFKDAHTPNIDKIFENGAVTYNAVTATPSISGQSWGSLMHGVIPVYHGLTNSTAEEYPPDSPYPSIFRVLREADPDCEMASIVNWNYFNEVVIEKNLGTYTDSGNEEQVANKVCNYLELNDPKLLFVYFGSPDNAGHSFGYGSKEHLIQIGVVDKYIGRIYNKLVSMEMSDDTLFIVTTDHGGTPEGQHGGSSPEEMNIMVAAAGKTVVKGEIGPMEIRDIPAIIAYALNIEKSPTWTSVVPSNLFKGVEGEERTIPYFPENSRFDNIGRQTPSPESGRYLTDYIPEDLIVEYITFDNNKTSSELGAFKASPKGKIHYVDDAVFGSAARMDDACITNSFDPVNSSFSISMWIEIFSGTINIPIVTNTDYYYIEETDGFTLRYEKPYIEFHLKQNGTQVKYDFELPDNYANGWMHLTFVVNRNDGKIGVSTDFGELIEFEIPEEVNSKSFKGSMHGLMMSHYNDKSCISFDDIIIFNKAIGSEEIHALSEYYSPNR